MQCGSAKLLSSRSNGDQNIVVTDDLQVISLRPGGCKVLPTRSASEENMNICSPTCLTPQLT